MKKTILVTLMTVMVATPCLAQEIEPDGLFSIEGTRWKVCFTQLDSTAPHLHHECPSSQTMGFYQDGVYWCYEDGACSSADPYYSYIDFFLVSFVTYHDPPTAHIGYALYILNPIIGLGFFTGFGRTPEDVWKKTPPYWWYMKGIMFKVDNNWTPPEEE